MDSTKRNPYREYTKWKLHFNDRGRRMRFFNKKRNTKQKTDIVIFMAIYEVNEFKRNFVLFKKKKNNRKELLERFHIAGISHDSTYITPDNKVCYDTEYNNIQLNSTIHFNFENTETMEAFDDKAISEMFYTIAYEQRARSLLDDVTMKITTAFNMESFLVEIDDNMYQVDPTAFILNASIVISFELIHFDSALPLSSSEIYGRHNNLSILPVKKVKYFNQEDFNDIEGEKKISDIIYDNIWSFFETAGSNRWKPDQYSYLQNILVVSNKISNIEKYFQNVLGAQIDDFLIKNIGSNSLFKYYAKEFLGLVVDVSDDSLSDVLIDTQVLEAFKMYLNLQLIIDYDINHDLEKLLDHQMFVKSLFYPRHVPIITMNVIENLKDTVSFKNEEQAIEFKIESLKLLQQRKKNNNGILLNALLFILAIISSLQFLDILQHELGIPFKLGLIVTCVAFTILLVVWILKETRNK